MVPSVGSRKLLTRPGKLTATMQQSKIKGFIASLASAPCFVISPSELIRYMGGARGSGLRGDGRHSVKLECKTGRLSIEPTIRFTGMRIGTHYLIASPLRGQKAK